MVNWTLIVFRINKVGVLHVIVSQQKMKTEGGTIGGSEDKKVRFLELTLD
jgi:hypothetical protein